MHSMYIHVCDALQHRGEAGEGGYLRILFRSGFLVLGVDHPQPQPLHRVLVLRLVVAREAEVIVLETGGSIISTENRPQTPGPLSLPLTSHSRQW